VPNFFLENERAMSRKWQKNSTGRVAVLLRPNTFQIIAVWIAAGLPAMYVHVQLTACMLNSAMLKIRLAPDLRDSSCCICRAVSVTRNIIIHCYVEDMFVHPSILCVIQSGLNPCTFFRTVWESFTEICAISIPASLAHIIKSSLLKL
jgi:hypothetical protein